MTLLQQYQQKKREALADPQGELMKRVLYEREQIFKSLDWSPDTGALCTIYHSENIAFLVAEGFSVVQNTEFPAYYTVHIPDEA